MLNKRLSGLILSVIVAGIFLGCNSSEKPQQEAQETEQSEPQTDAEYVEQASFTDLDGNTVEIADFEGKVVMIDFWETWCKPCLASFPTMQKLEEEYPDSFKVLAVTPGFIDTREDAKNFASEHDYTFNYLMDSNKLHEKLGVQGIPFKVYVDAEGNFIEKSMGTAGPQEDYKKLKKLIEKHKKS